jgi:hypothetical protein
MAEHVSPTAHIDISTAFCFLIRGITDCITFAVPKRNTSVLCPSSECSENAILLGIVNKNGRISFLGEKKIIIENEFVQIARKGRTPEKRFRFADGCMKGACKQ